VSATSSHTRILEASIQIGNDDILSRRMFEAVIENLPAQVKTAEHNRTLDKGAISLFVLGIAAIIAGIAIGIWPVALTGLGPLLLLVIDIRERKLKGTR
jgi:hypothetical protein